MVHVLAAQCGKGWNYGGALQEVQGEEGGGQEDGQACGTGASPELHDCLCGKAQQRLRRSSGGDCARGGEEGEVQGEEAQGEEAQGPSGGALV